MLKIILNRLKMQAIKIIAEVDNTPAELVQAGGEDVIAAVTTICNKIWQTGEWQTPWTHFPRKATCSSARSTEQSASSVTKAFDRVWHAALWATMKKYNISANLI